MDEAGTTLEALAARASDHGVRIPSEIGAFVTLEVCEALLTETGSVRASNVRVTEDGRLALTPSDEPASAEEATRSVVAILGALLLAAGPSVPRSLVDLVERGPSTGTWSLADLRDDLEASLVPLNRAAARRVLSRILRETRRPTSARPAAPAVAPGDATLDGHLGALLDAHGIASPSRPAAAPDPDATIAEAGVEDDDAASDDDDTVFDGVGGDGSELGETMLGDTALGDGVDAVAHGGSTSADGGSPASRRGKGGSSAGRHGKPGHAHAPGARLRERAPASRRLGVAALKGLLFLAFVLALVALLRPDLIDALFRVVR